MRIEPIFIIDGPGRGNRGLATNFENRVDATSRPLRKWLRHRSIVLKPSGLETAQDRPTECQTSPGIRGVSARAVKTDRANVTEGRK